MQSTNILFPYLVYYLHYKDSRHTKNNWNECTDYVCCVDAKDAVDAVSIAKTIALEQPKAKHIKIMGVVPGKREWIHNKPLTTNEDEYTAQVNALFNRLHAKQK